MKQVLLSCLKTGGKHAQNLLVNFISVVTAELLAEILDWWLFLVTMGKQVVTPEAAEAAAWSGKTVTFTDLQGLMEEWDAVPKIRARCKELGCLLVEVPPPGTKDVVPTAAISKTVENTRYNQEVLMPVLKRMQKARFAVPCIEVLGSEINCLLDSYGYKSTEKFVKDQAWSIRYIFGKMKAAMYKDAPPRVPCLKIILDFGKMLQRTISF